MTYYHQIMADIIREPIYEKIPVNEYQEPRTINDTIDNEEEKLIIPDKIDPTLSHLCSKKGCSVSTVFIAFFWCWLIPVCVLVFSACMNYPAQVCDPIRFPYMIASVVIMLFFSIFDIIMSRIPSCCGNVARIIAHVKILSFASTLTLIIMIITNELDSHGNGLQFNNGIVMILLIVTLCFNIIREIIMGYTLTQLTNINK